MIVDGAHNPAEMEALRRTLEHALPGRRVVVVFAVMADKDVGSMARSIAPLAKAVVATKAPGTSRAADPETLVQHFEGRVGKVVVESDADRALDLALSMSGRDGVVLVTGSLYIVGHLRSARLPVGAER